MELRVNEWMGGRSFEWVTDELRKRLRDFVANEIQILASVRVL